MGAWLIVVLCGAMTLGGCGYNMAGRGELPGGVQTMAVLLLENRSSETGVETQITNALINEFNRRRHGSVTSAARAEAVLRGTIDTITWSTVSRTGPNTAAERRVSASISLRLIDPEGNALWQRSGLQAQEAYLVADDKQETENNRRLAIDALAERIAEKVYRRLTDNF